MKIYKFGGTSVGTVERIQNLTKIVNNGEQNLVILSAMAGTTNMLEEIAYYTDICNKSKALFISKELRKQYNKTVEQLYSSHKYRLLGESIIESHFTTINNIINHAIAPDSLKTILAQGELISTSLFHIYLKELNIKSVLLNSTDFIKLNKDEEPDYLDIQIRLAEQLSEIENTNIIITQGYICTDHRGYISNLKRGGSDYTAAIIGAVIKAEEIQIWTDIDGLHNNDPRYVENTKPIREISFDEAAELAYFGAKILHPSSIKPAQVNNIPVRLKNTLNKEDKGTLISEKTKSDNIIAVASKDNITSLRIQSTDMLLAYGFLKKIFEIFERYKTPIDLIATSEVSVSLTIDDTSKLDKIVKELEKYGTVNIEDKQSIICIVGNCSNEKNGILATVFRQLESLPIKTVSYGGNTNNISILLDTMHKIEALNLLNSIL